MKSIIFFVFLICIQRSFGQTIKDDLYRMSHAYKDAPALSIDIMMTLLDVNSKVIESQTGSLQFDRNSYKLEFMGQTILSDGKNSVWVSHQEKYIEVSEAIPYEKIKNQFDFNRVDSLIRQASSIERIAADEREVQYRLGFNNTVITGIDLILERESGFLKEIIYTYNRKIENPVNEGVSFLKITYSTKVMKTLSPLTFSTSEYFIETDGVIHLSEKFKTYQLEIIDPFDENEIYSP